MPKKILQRASTIAATTAALTVLGGGVAFAAPNTDSVYDDVSYRDAYEQTIEGGAAVGYGLASMVVGGYTGLVTTADGLLDLG